VSIRPRFRLELPLRSLEIHTRLESKLACAGCPCRADVAGDHVEVTLRDDLRNFWSPHLSLEILEHPDGAVLTGLFGPSPNVWSMFLAAYAFLILCALFAGMLGLAQLTLGDPPWGLWIAAGSVLAGGGPYAGSLLGQRLAAEQMELLRCFLRESLALENEATPNVLCPAPTAPRRDLPVVDGR
jgi:hypothetical protein